METSKYQMESSWDNQVEFVMLLLSKKVIKEKL